MDTPTALADPTRDSQVRTLPPPDPETVASSRRRAGGRSLPNIPGLDGLRALAVIAVLLYHAGVTWIPGGFLGVEVFFVVSGYLITSLLMRERQGSGRVSLKHFWIRRARRLLPALLVMIAAVVVVWTFFVREQLSKLRGDVIASLLYVENWHLIASGQSYFDDFLRPSPLRHVWSLAVEEQFYLLWPLLVVVLAAATGMRRRPMIGALLAGALASYVLMQVLYTPGDPSRVYYGTDTRASALLLGGALALWWAPDRSRSALRGRSRQLGLELVGLAGMVLLALLFATTHDTSNFLYRAGFMLCTLATMGVVATSVRPTWVGRVLGLRPLRWVGLRSYGLYLWHWPIFVLTRPVLDLDWQWWKIFVFRMVLTVFLAGLSYRWIESPARRGGISAWLRSLKGTSARAGSRRTKTVVGLGAALAVLIPSTVVLARAQPVATQAEASIDEGAAVVARQAPLTAAPSAPRRMNPAADRAPATSVAATVAPTVPTSVAASPDTATSVPAPAPETTAAAATLPATVPTTIPAGPTIMIGDSVMLGAAGALVTALGPTTYVDAEVSRAFVRGIEIARSLRDQGLLGPVVVVHLGDNGPIREGEFEQMMEALAAVPRVLFVTVKVPRGWEEAVNLRLVEKVPNYPNARLVDWYGYSVNHPEWFYDDGIHLNPVGREAYAQLIAGSLTS